MYSAVAGEIRDAWSMAKPYDDDLRRKFLAAYDRRESTIPVLSARFGVSVSWLEYLRGAQAQRTGRASPASSWAQEQGERRGRRSSAELASRADRSNAGAVTGQVTQAAKPRSASV